MAVLQMQKIHICALNTDRKQILESLQRKGLVREVGYSYLGCGEEERLYAVCPSGAVEKDH